MVAHPLRLVALVTSHLVTFLPPIHPPNTTCRCCMIYSGISSGSGSLNVATRIGTCFDNYALKMVSSRTIHLHVKALFRTNSLSECFSLKSFECNGLAKPIFLTSLFRFDYTDPNNLSTLPPLKQQNGTGHSVLSSNQDGWKGLKGAHDDADALEHQSQWTVYGQPFLHFLRFLYSEI